MIDQAMLEDTQKPYSNDQYAAERERLLAFPDSRITFVRCELARANGTVPAEGCP